MKKWISILALVIVGFNIQAQTADDIINNHIKAIGGSKWNELNTMYCEMVTDMGGMKIPIKSWQSHLTGMRIEFEVQGMTGIQVITDKSGWSLMPFQGQTKPEPTNEEMLKGARSQLDLRGQLVDYKTKGSTVEYLGEDEDEGVEVYKIKLIDKEKTETTYFIDKSTYYVLKMINKVTFQGKEVEGITKFSNFKTVGGIVFPHSVDGQMGKVEFSKVEINPAIDATKYDMPTDK